ncbi:glycosyl hydrolase family 18 protein [Brevibacillus sp. AG162]|uniref:glycosyl hydrolase family 18 protein n=1 Tax=Brevibacillus sp. AG162 TaxID=2572910 RepID=UPI0011543469|nr:glycosyl hydrolase family 18 protein [Brevibacillus sp. AG162]
MKIERDTMKFKKCVRNVLMVGALLVTSVLPMAAQTAQAEENQAEATAVSNYKIIGYYPSWGAYGRNYNVTDIDPNKVTHINYAFADICWNGRHGNPDPTGPNPQTWACQDEVGNINAPNGTVVLGDPWIDVQKSFPGDTWDQPIRGNLNQLAKLKQKNPQLKTLISIGGWTWSNRFSDVAADPAAREVFAQSSVDFIRKYQMDGVDLDWEYPVEGGLPGNSKRPEDKQNYTLLLQAVRDKLDAAEVTDGKQYYLTIASGASPSYAANTELGNIARVVDWINIMTYDFYGAFQKQTGHNAPLAYDPAAGAAGLPNAQTYNVQTAVEGHLRDGVPASKLVLGLPFYGRGWSGCGTANNGEYQNCTGPSTGTWEPGMLDFTDIQNNYLNKNGFTRHWNDAAKVPYLFNPASKTYISYDDVTSIGHKTSYIASKGLAGAMFWEFSGDRNKVLLDKVNGDLLGGTAPVDNVPPTAPANLQSTAKTATSVSLSWGAATDNVGVTGYEVYNGTQLAKTVTGTNTTISGLTAGTAYQFTVKAKDAAGNSSAASNEVTVTTDTIQPDNQPPSTPANLVITGKTGTSISLSWDASTDNIAVTNYQVYNGAALAADVATTTATVTGLTPNTSYTFSVVAKDAAGNSSQKSIEVVGVTDAENPGTPAWAPNVNYVAGDLVSYQGRVYKCLQPHTSLVGWEPTNVAALWQVQQQGAVEAVDGYVDEEILEETEGAEETPKTEGNADTQ